MLEEERRRRLIERINLADVISGYMPIQRADIISRLLCPFHNDRLGTLEVDQATKIFQCRACGAGSDVVDFVRMYEAISVPDALEMLEARSGD